MCAVAASCAGGSDGGSSTGTSGTSTTLGAAATTTIADTTTVPAPTTTVASPQVGDIASSTLDPTTVALHASRDGNDGLLAVQETVDLFAAVYGPVPGADADRFDVGPRGGTMAVRNVFRVWGELTPDQRAAVTDLLGLDPSEAPAGLRSRTPPAALQTEEQVLLVAESIRDEIAGLLGVDLAMGSTWSCASRIRREARRSRSVGASPTPSPTTPAGSSCGSRPWPTNS